jgi:steroid delta-isomerase-like uncharacterized protein
MDDLIDRHLAAEIAGDTAASVAMYTDDVVHDVVGFPTGPVEGKAAALGFYNYLTANFHTETLEQVRRFHAEDACIVEHVTTGTVPGDLLGVPGGGRRVSFRQLHVWEFRDGLISRENVWIDAGAIIAQLTAEEPDRVTV